MNRKVKKQTVLLKEKLQHLRQQLSGAKKQTDDPQEVAGLQAEIAKAEAALENLKDE